MKRMNVNTNCHAELVSGSRRFLNGFTLIELLVVVLIIGILAAVALPQYQKTMYITRATEGLAKLENAANFFELYYLEYGTYPVQKTGEINLDLDVVLKSDTVWQITWNNGYIGFRLNKDPGYVLAYIPMRGGSSNPGRFSCNIVQEEDSRAVEICKYLCHVSSLREIWGRGNKGCVIKS